MDRAQNKHWCSVHYTAISRRCMADASCSRAVCTKDLERIIILIPKKLNMFLILIDNLKVNLIQRCLVVCSVVRCQIILSGADYMRETGSHLDHLDLPKTSQVWKYFFSLYDEKMYPVHKQTKSGSKKTFYHSFKSQKLVL